MKTVFVLGAGSSADFKLPTGLGLAAKISQAVAFDFDEMSRPVGGEHLIWRALKAGFPERSRDLFRSAHKVARGLPLARSIDDLLYNHGDDELAVTVGKAGIVWEILKAEKNSPIVALNAHEQADREACVAQLSHTWLFRLLSYLQTGVRRAEVGRIFERISIINFNYDRCVEHFLFHALQMAYSIEAHEAAEVMATLDVTHPYGDVGDLPWENSGSNLPFGVTLREGQILSAAERIKTYTEQRHDDGEKGHWQKVLAEAQSIVFLGFAFHKQNMNLLEIPILVDHFEPFICATTFGASAQDQEVFQRRISSTFPGSDRRSPPTFLELKCDEFMTQMGLKLLDQ